MTNWRSCADDPPDQHKEVLVRYDITHHSRDVRSHKHVAARWEWNGYTKNPDWITIDGLKLSNLEVFEGAEWTELPK
jgi:hypothetical protein